MSLKDDVLNVLKNTNVNVNMLEQNINRSKI